MKNLWVLLILLSIQHFAFSQEYKTIEIVNIIDTNLFLSKNGQFVKLANVETVPISADDSNLSKKIFKYAEKMLKNQPLKYIETQQKFPGDTLFVHLYQRFFVPNKCFNIKYLKEGFGKYANTGDGNDIETYVAAEQYARSRNRGIWENQLVTGIPNPDDAYSIHFRYSNSMRERGGDRPFRVFNLNYDDFSGKHRLRLNFSSIFNRHTANSVDDVIVSARFYNRRKGAAVDFGLVYAHQFTGEARGKILFPVVGFEYGDLDKMYTSFHILDEILLTGLTWGMNFRFNNPISVLTVGQSFGTDKWMPFAKLKFSLADVLVIDFQGKYHFGKKYGSFTFGFGTILNH